MDFDPEEIRRIVAIGKKRGLIKEAAPVNTEHNLKAKERTYGKKAEKLHLCRSRREEALAESKATRTPAAQQIPTLQINAVEISAAELGNMRSQWMDITPALAQEWLGANTHNRRLREDTVRAYARDMCNGEWVPTHQGIAFNDENALLDGQHRLHAIIRSKKTVRMMVTFGLPARVAGKPEMFTMDAVDRGATRSVADQLDLQHSIKAGTKVAAVATALASLCCGERTRRLSVTQTLEVYRAFQSAVDYVIENASKKKGLRCTGILAGFAFAIAAEGEIPKGGPADLATAFTALNTGEGLETMPALAKLRGFLTTTESGLFTRSLDRGLAELVMQALWLDRHGKPCAQLAASLDGANWWAGRQPARIQKIAAIFCHPVKGEE